MSYLETQMEALALENPLKATAIAMKILKTVELIKADSPSLQMRSGKAAFKMLADLDVEMMIAVMFDRKGSMFIHEGPFGDIRTSILFFRPLAKEILLRDAVVVHFYHNHPCGNIPSDTDKELKETLIEYFHPFELQMEFRVVTPSVIFDY